MALRKDFIKTLPGFDGSLTASDVYWKITNVQGGKDGASYTIEGFKGDQQVFGYSFDFIPSMEDGSGNFIKQAYEHAKTLPEFADAGDA